jgi:hypothetical protein
MPSAFISLYCQGLKGRLYRAFLVVYPFLHASWEGSVFCFQLLYIFGETNCHSPLLRVAGLRLRNLTDEEQSASKISSVPLSVLLANKKYVVLRPAFEFAAFGRILKVICYCWFRGIG